MNNIIFKINNQTFHKDFFIRNGDAISFVVELDAEAINMIYACVGNLHDNRYEFQKELGDGITDLGDNKYQVIVDSADTQNMPQGIYHHNLKVETFDGAYTIIYGLIFVENNIGEIKYQSKSPMALNFDTFIDGTIKEALVVAYNEIPSYLFAGCNQLEKIYWSPLVESIGQGAFYNCTNLALTTLPDSLTSIGNSAFSGCTNLALTTLPDGLTSIESNAFAFCTNLALTTLPDGVEILKGSVFYGTNITSITLPNRLKTINAYAFDGCNSLKKVTFSNKPTSIAGSAFYMCHNITDIYVPWSSGEVSGSPWGATNATIHYNS